MKVKSKKGQFFLRVLMIISLFAAAVLGYGYWHASTHASYHIDMRLASGDDGSRDKMPLAKVTFYDYGGNPLAKGINDEQYGYVHLLHPQVGDCHEIEEKATMSAEGRTAWQECFAKLATWIPTWAEKVHTVDVSYQGQQFNKIPVTVKAYNSEWPLWWIPLPHVGGKPYTYYRTTITVDRE